MEIPVINVGILTEKEISFVFNDPYIHIETGEYLCGDQRALFLNGNILFNGKLYEELFFEPSAPETTFDLKEVTIGVKFHWQQKEDQRFRGSLNLVTGEGEGITAINQVDIESYLTSVISSEMNASASAEFLKAHAVISRSWLLAQLNKNKSLSIQSENYNSYYSNERKLMRWYDREDHAMFDVCADDHCQRYQGITRSDRPEISEIIAATFGEVITYEGDICDTRFSKCCGGVTELFETCWEPVIHPYLTVLRDDETKDYPDLTSETEAQSWIRNNPSTYCNTRDKTILSQVLNNYDQKTTDFYRWKVIYSQQELSELISRKSGRDFGAIKDLIPLKRGTSGRIEELMICGTNLTYTIGKELEIRKVLSESHLYSSAFVIDKEGEEEIPKQFILRGAGWGHGVGLCQIGAAVMGEKGFSYIDILLHYFRNTQLEKRY